MRNRQERQGLGEHMMKAVGPQSQAARQEVESADAFDNKLHSRTFVLRQDSDTEVFYRTILAPKRGAVYVNDRNINLHDGVN